MEQQQHCKKCDGTDGLYASGECEWCVGEEKLANAVSNARASDEHSPQEGSLWERGFIDAAVNEYERGQS